MNNPNNPPVLRQIVLGGLLAALVLALTMAVAIPIPNMAGAYMNLGDVGVYLCAFLMGAPWGGLCAAAGSALADLLLGSALYAGPTFIIKGAMALLAAAFMKRWKRLPALLAAGVVMPLGYFIFEAILYGTQPALIGLPANLVQYAVGAALALPVIRVSETVLPRGWIEK